MNRLHNIALAGILYTSNILYGQPHNLPVPDDSTSLQQFSLDDRLAPIPLHIRGDKPLEIDYGLFSVSEQQRTDQSSIYDLPCPPSEKTNFYEWTKYVFTKVPFLDAGLAGIRAMESTFNETPQERSPPFGFCSPKMIPLLFNLGVNASIEVVSYFGGKAASMAIRRGVSRFAKEAHQVVQDVVSRLNLPGGGFSFGRNLSFGVYYGGFGIRYNTPKRLVGWGAQQAGNWAKDQYPSTDEDISIEQQAQHLGYKLNFNIDPCSLGDSACKDLVESINQQFQHLRHDTKNHEETGRMNTSVIHESLFSHQSLQETANKLQDQLACTETSSQNYLHAISTMAPVPASPGDSSRSFDGGSSSDHNLRNRGNSATSKSGNEFHYEFKEIKSNRDGSTRTREYKLNCKDGKCISEKKETKEFKEKKDPVTFGKGLGQK